MKYIIKGIIIGSIGLNFLYSAQVNVVELVLLLGLITSTLFVDTQSKWIKLGGIILELIIVSLIGIYTDYVFWGILILLFDTIYTRHYYIGIAIVTQLIYFRVYEKNLEIWPLLIIIGIIAFVLHQNEVEKRKHYNIIDEERRTKYELELAKVSLQKSNKEIQSLAQARERNRIARDVHDNIGHSIAGILIKLQATKKVLEKDTKKGNTMLDDCIAHLKQSLEMLRDTVHNMYSHEKRGIEFIKNIVDEYKYCKSEIKVEGQFANCDERIFEALSYVLKEALTNTARHSHATCARVNLDCKDNIVAMQIIDDGIGCMSIKESLGIRSMRDRIRVLNGKFSIDGDDGMHIWCEIPLVGSNI